MKKDFWPSSKVAVLGGGNWGTILANLISKNCSEIRLWVRTDEQARGINATRFNTEYYPELKLPPNISAYHDISRVFEGGVHAVIWALPSSICREKAKEFAKYFSGDEVIIHATKGVEPGTLKRISVILREELPAPRIGVISGPNLALEIARGEPAASVVASAFEEVIAAGEQLLSSEKFRIYHSNDVVGVEWAGSLKNILSIASGSLEGLGLGMNARSMLITRGLAEMVRFGMEMGGKTETFLGLAGVGDLMATCGSPLSRNFQVGLRLAKGEKLDAIITAMNSTAEGVGTARFVWEFAKARSIAMPITEAVNQMLSGAMTSAQALDFLMTHPRLE